jgi:hypothetical protein
MKHLIIGVVITLATAVTALAADLPIPRVASVSGNGFVSRSHAVPVQTIPHRPPHHRER